MHVELYRLPPFPLTFQVDVGVANTALSVSISSYETDTEWTTSVVSNSQGRITLSLPEEYNKYDDEYSLDVRNGVALVYSDNLTVIRPYFDPRDMATTPEELEAWSEHEIVARNICDALVGGFYYKKMTFERMGNGNAALTLGYPVKKLLQVKEDGVLVYDINSQTNEREFIVSDNGIYLHDTEDDHWFGCGCDTFKQDSSYMITAEVGWQQIPVEVSQAAKLLATDFADGHEGIIDQYISRYETNEFRVHLSAHMFQGTGNRRVDRLLSKFYGQNLFRTVGVL